MKISGTQFEAALRSILGPDYTNAAAANLLETNPRNIQRMRAGQMQMPERVAVNLLPLIAERVQTLRAEQSVLCTMMNEINVVLRMARNTEPENVNI